MLPYSTWQKSWCTLLFLWWESSAAKGSTPSLSIKLHRRRSWNDTQFPLITAFVNNLHSKYDSRGPTLVVGIAAVVGITTFVNCFAWVVSGNWPGHITAENVHAAFGEMFRAYFTPFALFLSRKQKKWYKDNCITFLKYFLCNCYVMSIFLSNSNWQCSLNYICGLSNKIFSHVIYLFLKSNLVMYAACARAMTSG